MSLRHAILGLLARRPSTGYELTRTFDQTLRTSWHASHSQIYPELAKLEAADLVVIVEHGARRSKTYGITRAGRAELRRWLVESEPDRSQRNESSLRLFLTRSWTQPTAGSAADQEVFAPQIELGIRINQILKDWLREQIAAAAADGPEGSDSPEGSEL